MTVLLYSMVLYLLGIVVILYIKPRYMFHENGQWKDFGINSTETTLFPIWMFCIVWAIVSYLFVHLLFSSKGGKAAYTATAVSLTSTVAEELSNTKAKTITENSKPGYYKLDESTLKKRGVPRYIYIGEETPSDLED